MARTKSPFTNPCCPNPQNNSFIKVIQNSRIQELYDNLTTTQKEDLVDIFLTDQQIIVENSDQSYQEIITSDPFLLPDIDLIQDAQVVGTIPSVQDININIVIQ